MKRAPKRKPRTFKVWVDDDFEKESSEKNARVYVYFGVDKFDFGQRATLTLTGKGKPGRGGRKT